MRTLLATLICSLALSTPALMSAAQACPGGKGKKACKHAKKCSKCHEKKEKTAEAAQPKAKS